MYIDVINHLIDEFLLYIFVIHCLETGIYYQTIKFYLKEVYEFNCIYKKIVYVIYKHKRIWRLDYLDLVLFTIFLMRFAFSSFLLLL